MALRWGLFAALVFCSLGYFLVEGNGFEGIRRFSNVCENCTISKGFGFASHFSQCNCYYMCVLKAAEKLASYAEPWVSYLRCCPCHMTFSKKLLTCVDFTDKRSDCFNRYTGNNPCEGFNDGDKINAQDPNMARPGSVSCSGFLKCVNVGGTVVPHPSCCPNGQCFSPTSLECDHDACTDEEPCASLRYPDDCECEQTKPPEKECAFVPRSNNIFQFMGRENMKIYDCAPGTCWDQYSCTCVRTNNTGYNDCTVFAELDFDNNDYRARDNLGNTIWTELCGGVSIINEYAYFPGDGFIAVGGLANTFLGNKLVFHFYFYHSGLNGTQECLVGSCQENETFPVDEKFFITFENELDDTDEMNVCLTYKDTHFWLPGVDTTERVYVELHHEIEPFVGYEFWMFYGWEEIVTIGLIGSDGTVVANSANIPGSKQLLPPESGFLFGHCLSGEDFTGVMDNLEMYRCKPFGEPAFEHAFEEIYDFLG